LNGCCCQHPEWQLIACSASSSFNTPFVALVGCTYSARELLQVLEGDDFAANNAPTASQSYKAKRSSAKAGATQACSTLVLLVKTLLEQQTEPLYKSLALIALRFNLNAHC
jgi:hypothetical protein